MNLSICSGLWKVPSRSEQWPLHAGGQGARARSAPVPLCTAALLCSCGLGWASKFVLIPPTWMVMCQGEQEDLGNNKRMECRACCEGGLKLLSNFVLRSVSRRKKVFIIIAVWYTEFVTCWYGDIFFSVHWVCCAPTISFNWCIWILGYRLSGLQINTSAFI